MMQSDVFRIRQKPQGFALMMVIVGVLILSAIGITLVGAAGRDKVGAGQSRQMVTAVYGAEGSVVHGISHLNDILKTNPKPNASDLASILPPEIDVQNGQSQVLYDKYSVNYVDPANNFAIIPDPTTYEPPFTPVESGMFQGLNALQYYVEVLASTSYRNAKATIADVQRIENIPVFQFALFYNSSIEFDYPEALTMKGRVHTNRNFHFGGGSDRLKFESASFTAAGRFVLRDLVSGSSDTDNSPYLNGDQLECDNAASGGVSCPGGQSWASYTNVNFPSLADQDTSPKGAELKLPTGGDDDYDKRVYRLPDVCGIDENEEFDNTPGKGKKQFSDWQLIDYPRTSDDSTLRGAKLAWQADIRVLDGVWYKRGDAEPYYQQVWFDQRDKLNDYTQCIYYGYQPSNIFGLGGQIAGNDGVPAIRDIRFWDYQDRRMRRVLQVDIYRLTNCLEREFHLTSDFDSDAPGNSGSSPDYFNGLIYFGETIGDDIDYDLRSNAISLNTDHPHFPESSYLDNWGLNPDSAFYEVVNQNNATGWSTGNSYNCVPEFYNLPHYLRGQLNSEVFPSLKSPHSRMPPYLFNDDVMLSQAPVTGLYEWPQLDNPYYPAFASVPNDVITQNAQAFCTPYFVNSGKNRVLGLGDGPLRLPQGNNNQRLEPGRNELMENGLMLINGQRLPNRTENGDPVGFSVATNMPVYIKGDYNTQNHEYTYPADPSQFSAGSVPAAIMADAVTFLSNKYNELQDNPFAPVGPMAVWESMSDKDEDDMSFDLKDGNPFTTSACYDNLANGIDSVEDLNDRLKVMGDLNGDNKKSCANGWRTPGTETGGDGDGDGDDDDDTGGGGGDDPCDPSDAACYCNEDNDDFRLWLSYQDCEFMFEKNMHYHEGRNQGKEYHWTQLNLANPDRRLGTASERSDYNDYDILNSPRAYDTDLRHTRDKRLVAPGSPAPCVNLLRELALRKKLLIHDATYASSEADDSKGDEERPYAECRDSTGTSTACGLDLETRVVNPRTGTTTGAGRIVVVGWDTGTNSNRELPFDNLDSFGVVDRNDQAVKHNWFWDLTPYNRYAQNCVSTGECPDDRRAWLRTHTGADAMPLDQSRFNAWSRMFSLLIAPLPTNNDEEQGSGDHPNNKREPETHIDYQRFMHAFVAFAPMESFLDMSMFMNHRSTTATPYSGTAGDSLPPPYDRMDAYWTTANLRKLPYASRTTLPSTRNDREVVRDWMRCSLNQEHHLIFNGGKGESTNFDEDNLVYSGTNTDVHGTVGLVQPQAHLNPGGDLESDPQQYMRRNTSNKHTPKYDVTYANILGHGGFGAMGDTGNADDVFRTTGASANVDGDNFNDVLFTRDRSSLVDPQQEGAGTAGEPAEVVFPFDESNFNEARRGDQLLVNAGILTGTTWRCTQAPPAPSDHNTHNAYSQGMKDVNTGSTGNWTYSTLDEGLYGLLRLQESWYDLRRQGNSSGGGEYIDLYINGSIINAFHSQESNGMHILNQGFMPNMVSGCSGQDNNQGKSRKCRASPIMEYGWEAPERHIQYDQYFNDAKHIPPGTPSVANFTRQRWIRR